MGLSSSKSTTKNTPIYEPQITGAASDISSALHAQNPKLTATTDALNAQVPGLMQSYAQGDPNVNAASGFNRDVLGGKYLNANPYLDRSINSSNNDIRNQTQSAMGVHGNWGDSSAMADIVSRNIGNNENTMRMGAYNTGLGLMGQQAGLSGAIAGAKYQPLEQAANIAQAQQLPVQTAVGAGNGIGGLLGQYQKGVTKTTPNFGEMMMKAAAQAAQAAAMCDERLKTDIRRVGKTDAGLPIYSFRYHGDNEPRMGPMAHEVAFMQPENLGPTIGGYMSVKLGSIR